MTRLVTTPQMPPSWMLALAEGKVGDTRCSSCHGPIEVVQHIVLDGDLDARQITLCLERCGRCARRPISVARETAAGTSTKRRPCALAAWQKLAALLASCPEPSNVRCECEAHLRLRARDGAGEWVGLERFLTAPTTGVPQTSTILECATAQLRVVRMLLDWIRLEDAEQLAGHNSATSRRDRGRAVCAAAEEAADFIRPSSTAPPDDKTVAAWKARSELLTTWAQANESISELAAVRAGRGSGTDLLQRDAVRTASQRTARHVRTAASALEQSGYEEIGRTMATLAEAFESFGGVGPAGASHGFQIALEAWADVVPPAAMESHWWAELVAAQRTLAERLSSWLDTIGAGGDVAANLAAERAPVREAAESAAKIALDASRLRPVDARARHWETEATAARALATAATDTDRVTHAGTAAAGPIEAHEEQPLDERQLELSAAEAASSWFAAAASWSALREDQIAHACRSTAVALGAVSVLDGITAATLGWAAREAWRSV